MGTLRFADLQTRPTEVLDLTSLTVEEFQPLAPPFDTAFQAHMAQGRFDGHRRTARRYRGMSSNRAENRVKASSFLDGSGILLRRLSK